MPSPDLADLENPDLWTGGWYELAIELGPRNDERLQVALEVLWNEAKIDGCKALVSREPYSLVDAPLTVASLEEHQLRGSVRVPSGHSVACAASAVREDNGPDWLDFGFPLGALEPTDQRIGGYPFDPDDGPESLAWRRPLDDWLSFLALSIFGATGFALALIGHEVSGFLHAAQVAENGIPDPRYFGIVLPGPPPRYPPATA